MDPQKELQKIIQDLKDKKYREGEAKGLIETIGSELQKQLAPLFEGHSKEMTSKVADAVKEAVGTLSVNPQVNIPEHPAPVVNVPAPVVNVPAPVVNVPAPVVNIPEIKFPAQLPFPEGFRVNNQTPLKVVMVDVNGKPTQFPVSVGGGGRGDFFTITGITNTVGFVQVNPDGLPFYSSSSSSSATSTQLVDSSNAVYSQANPVPVTVVSGSAATTGSALIDSSGVQYSGSNPFPVTITSGGTATSASNIVDSSGVAYSGSNPVPITLISGALTSTKAQIGNSDGDFSVANPLPVLNMGPVAQGDSTSALRIIQAGDSVSSVIVNSGVITSVTSITNSLSAALIDSSGVQYSGSNPVPMTGTVVVSSITNSTAVANIDSSGVQYSGSNPFPFTLVTNATATINTALTDSGGVQYSGSNPVPVTLISGSISSTRAQIGNSDGDFSAANPLPVVFSSTSSTGSALIDSSGVQYSGSNPVPVVFSSTTTTGSNIVDSGGVAYSGSNPFPVTFTGSSSTSVSLVNSDGVYYNSDTPFFVTDPVTGLNETNNFVQRTVLMTDSVSSSNIVSFNGNAPAQGTNEIVGGVMRVMEMSGNVTSANIVTFNGNAPATGLNETNVGVLRVAQMTDVVSSVNVVSSAALTVTSITNSAAAYLVDSGGVGYNGSNPLPVVVSGSASSTVVVGDAPARAADTGSNPIKVGGIARTTNPTAFADGDRSNFATDKLGRQLTRPVQVRDLIKTAYATLSTQAETTVLTATAGTFADLIFLTATNASASAWKVDIRATTGGNILHTMNLPASTGPIGFNLPVPWPQDSTGNSWTATISSGTDVSNANVFISGLFSQEI